MSKDITVRQGETFQLPVTTDDGSAETVEINVWDEDGNIVLEGEATFTDGQATIDTGIIDLEIGEYNYSITVNYSDGVVDVLPDPSDCDGDECVFPLFTVCEGTPEGS